MKITFVGHSKLCQKKFLFNDIVANILANVEKTEKITFYCGGYGDFDDLCLRACHLIRKNGFDCEIGFVTPYITFSQQKKINALLQSKVYDFSIYPPIENVPYRLAIIKRNEWMIDNADLIISYVKFNCGGAYKTLQYARKNGKSIVNLAESLA